MGKVLFFFRVRNGTQRNHPALSQLFSLYSISFVSVIYFPLVCWYSIRFLFLFSHEKSQQSGFKMIFELIFYFIFQRPYFQTTPVVLCFLKISLFRKNSNTLYLLALRFNSLYPIFVFRQFFSSFIFFLFHFTLFLFHFVVEYYFSFHIRYREKRLLEMALHITYNSYRIYT